MLSNPLGNAQQGDPVSLLEPENTLRLPHRIIDETIRCDLANDIPLKLQTVFAGRAGTRDVGLMRACSIARTNRTKNGVRNVPSLEQPLGKKSGSGQADVSRGFLDDRDLWYESRCLPSSVGPPAAPSVRKQNERGVVQ